MVGKGTEFYNRLMRPWLQDNGVEMYSANNKEKSIAAKRFIKTLKNRIEKYRISLSKNVHIKNV